MMRKFALILLRDIMQDNDSLVRREFSNLLTPKDEAKIREAFTDPFTEPDDDINTSVDQTKNLRAAIAMGLKYPDRVDGRFNYDDVLAFLEKRVGSSNGENMKPPHSESRRSCAGMRLFLFNGWKVLALAIL